MRFIIPGIPYAMQRNRHKLLNGKVWNYNPQKREQDAVRIQLIAQIREAFDSLDHKINVKASNLIYNHRFHVEIYFGIPIPQSFNQGDLNDSLWNFSFPTQKDIDNYVKFYLDCGNEILFPDDSFISSIYAKKYYTKTPQTIIIVEPIRNLNLHEMSLQILKYIAPEQLLELVEDAKKIAELDTNGLEETPVVVERLQLDTSALLLKNFADKYSELLRKIKKL